MSKFKTVPARFLIMLALTAGLIGCKSSGSGKKDAGRQGSLISNIEGYLVKRSSIDQTITISGTLKPMEETVLMPEVPGRIVKINLEEGKFVKEGTLLIKLFDEDLQAQLHKSQSQLQITEQTQERQEELVKVNGISQSDYDQTRLQVNSIKADIEVLKVQIRKTEVNAPYDGVIGLRNVSLGAEVTTATPLATIRAINQLKLDFSVPEKYSSMVKPGDQVNFYVQGQDEKYQARVMATEEGIDQSTRNLKVRALVQNRTEKLIPGAFANVELQLNVNQNALLVPTQAIIPTDLDKKVIVSKGGKAKFLSVVTGVRLDSMVEVTKGLTSGDTVATTGILFIRPGSVLKFSRINK